MRVVVVGGGVAGVAVVEQLCALRRGDVHVTLISASPTVKGVSNYIKLSDALESFDLAELDLHDLARGRGDSVAVMQGVVVAVNDTDGSVTLGDGRVVPYDKLCICTGAQPNLILPDHPRVLGLRDSETVEALAEQLRHCRRMVVVGNGGIALGVVHQLTNVDMVWVLRDGYIGNTFFDANASQFLLAAHAHRVEVVGSHTTTPTTPATHIVSPLVTGSGVDEGSAAAVYDWHTDAPLPSSMPGGGVDGGEGEGDIEPSYDPLPPRAGRRRRHREADGGGDHSASLSWSACDAQPRPPKVARAGGAGGVGNAGGVLGKGGGDGAMPVRHVYGSCLGPGWLTAMKEKVPAAMGSPSGGGDDAHHDAPAPAPSMPSAAKVRCEMGAEVTHIMDSGNGLGWVPCHAGTRVPAATGAAAHVSSIPTLPSLSACVHAHGEWRLYVRLSNGHVHGCDVVLSATGVSPAFPFLPHDTVAWPRGTNGGLVVNQMMQVLGHANVYACGDAASIEWPAHLPRYAPRPAPSPSALSSLSTGAAVGEVEVEVEVPLWFQMRLWNQARSQGMYTAKCMANAVDALEMEDGGVAFELFAHMTRFMGYKVVLLGLFNGQGLGAEYEQAVRMHLLHAHGGSTGSGTGDGGDGGGGEERSVQLHFRVTPGVEYIKLVVLRGKLVGAMLIGDTDLEETMENLMLNRLPLDTISGGAVLDLLNPDVDVEDYFD